MSETGSGMFAHVNRAISWSLALTLGRIFDGFEARLTEALREEEEMACCGLEERCGVMKRLTGTHLMLTCGKSKGHENIQHEDFVHGVVWSDPVVPLDGALANDPEYAKDDEAQHKCDPTCEAELPHPDRSLWMAQAGSALGELEKVGPSLQMARRNHSIMLLRRFDEQFGDAYKPVIPRDPEDVKELNRLREVEANLRNELSRLRGDCSVYGLKLDELDAKWKSALDANARYITEIKGLREERNALQEAKNKLIIERDVTRTAPIRSELEDRVAKLEERLETLRNEVKGGRWG